MMKKYVIISIFLVLTECTFSGLIAQSGTWNLWTGVTLEKDLGKHWEVSLGPEWRMEMWNDKNEYLIETGLSYAPIPYLKLEGKYRYTFLYTAEKVAETSHQMAFDIKGKYGYKRFDFQLRTRLTNYSDFEMGEYLVNPYLRYRLKAEYNIKGIKLFPSFSLELFHQLDDREINKLRMTMGLEYHIQQHHRLEINYHLQDYLKKAYFRNVVALQYKFVF